MKPVASQKLMENNRNHEKTSIEVLESIKSVKQCRLWIKSGVYFLVKMKQRTRREILKMKQIYENETGQNETGWHEILKLKMKPGGT